MTFDTPQQHPTKADAASAWEIRGTSKSVCNFQAAENPILTRSADQNDLNVSPHRCCRHSWPAAPGWTGSAPSAATCGESSSLWLFRCGGRCAGAPFSCSQKRMEERAHEGRRLALCRLSEIFPHSVLNTRSFSLLNIPHRLNRWTNWDHTAEDKNVEIVRQAACSCCRLDGEDTSK